MPNYLYTFSTGSTESYELPGYVPAAESFQGVSEASFAYIESVYNINYQKIFAGTSNDSTGLTIYNSANTRTVMSISAETFGITVDNTNNLVAIVNTSNGGLIDNVVVVVDASSDTVVNTVNVIDSYIPELPRLPSGYFGMFFLAYLPPLWYRVMDPLLIKTLNGDVSRINFLPSAKNRLIKKFGLVVPN